MYGDPPVCRVKRLDCSGLGQSPARLCRAKRFMVVSAPPDSRFAFDSSDSAVRALGSCHGRAAKSGSHFYPWEMGRTQLSRSSRSAAGVIEQLSKTEGIPSARKKAARIFGPRTCARFK